jgi:hypothetical protein
VSESEAHFRRRLEVISGHEDKKGNIHVVTMLAESGYLNDNEIGFTPELLERWHKENAWEGLCQNAHPSKNHPLIYEDKPPSGASIAERALHYITKSNKWGYGSYLKTKLKNIENGQKRLLGVFRITDGDAKQAWREGKFPKYNSSSVLIVDKDPNTNLITDAIPIASTSVDKPAFPVDVAGIYDTCVGGDECVTKLAESSINCEYCRHSVLTSFYNKFSSNSDENISESSMVEEKPQSDSDQQEDEEKDKPEGTSSSTGTPFDKISETHTSADGTKTETIMNEELDYKKRYEEEVKAHNQTKKAKTDYETATTERILNIEKDRLSTKIKSILDKVPLNLAFDGKEENREKQLKKYVNKYNGKNEKEIIEDVEDKYMIVLKVKEHAKGKVGESGLISNDAPLTVGDDGKASTTIFDITGVFG